MEQTFSSPIASFAPTWLVTQLKPSLIKGKEVWIISAPCLRAVRLAVSLLKPVFRHPAKVTEVTELLPPTPPPSPSPAPAHQFV